MIHLRWTHTRVPGAPCPPPMGELTEHYCWTKLAQAQAERHGFGGTATALASLAGDMAQEHGAGTMLGQGHGFDAASLVQR